MERGGVTTMTNVNKAVLLQKVRFLVSIPEFVGMDTKQYGSFKKGDIANLPDLNAKALINRHACVPHDSYKFFDNGMLKPKKFWGRTEAEIKRSLNPDDNSPGCVSCNDGLSNSTSQGDDSGIFQFNNTISYVMPGQGANYDECGHVKFGVSCKVDDYRKVVFHHCDRPECPVCNDGYAYRKAKDMADRLFEGNRLYYKHGYKMGYLKHFILSPPQQEAITKLSTLNGYRALRTECKDLLLNNGVRGGIIVFHMYRMLPEIAVRLQGVGYGVKSGKGSLWDGVVADGLELGSAYKYVYLSPHFHVHAYGNLTYSPTFKRDTNWVYVNRKGRSTFEGMVKSIKYTLQHASRVEEYGVLKCQVASYFGLYSYRSLSKDYIETKEITEKCPHCGESLFLHTCWESHKVDWDSDEGLYWKKVRIKYYKIKV